MSHPLQAIAAPRRLPLFLTLLVLTLLVGGALQYVNGPLKGAGAGILCFEFAGSGQAAGQILAGWQKGAVLAHAGFSLGLDFLFIPLYSTTLAFACLRAGLWLGLRRWPLAGLGVPLAWGQWAAGLLDVVENVALAVQVFGSSSDGGAMVAFGCAAVKFALIALGLVYAVYGAASRVKINQVLDKVR
jgi:hypothetical protein